MSPLPPSFLPLPTTFFALSFFPLMYQYVLYFFKTQFFFTPLHCRRLQGPSCYTCSQISSNVFSAWRAFENLSIYYFCCKTEILATFLLLFLFATWSAFFRMSNTASNLSYRPVWCRNCYSLFASSLLACRTKWERNCMRFCVWNYSLC